MSELNQPYTYATQLEWIRQLHDGFRSNAVDQFFLAWNAVDSTEFAILVIASVWFLVQRKVGIKLYYIWVLSSLINLFLKQYFGLPRPCQIDPSIGVVCSSSFGFPSGGAQTAILLSGVIFVECKKRLYRILGVIFALFLCFSRVYLGMHYPIDILGGVLIGGVLVFVYWKSFPKFEKTWKRWAFFFPIVFLFFPLKIALNYAFITGGVGTGLWAYQRLKFHQAKKLSVRITETFVAIIGLAASFQWMKASGSYSPIIAFLSGLWLSFLTPWFVFRMRFLVKALDDR